jgi:UDP:flavonoid glycosyltransferase YjiC (YdhE family)
MPFLAVAEALRRRGHEVVIASHAGYAQLVQRAGFGFAIIWNAMPAGLDDLLERAPDRAWDQVRHALFEPAVGPTAAFIRHAGAAVRNCVVLASWSAFGAVGACRDMGLPLIRVCLSPHAMQEAAHQPGHGYWLGFFPGWFCTSQPDWPDIRLTGFPMLDDSLVPPLEPALDSFLDAGPPPIVFTPGSYQRRSRRFFAQCMESCAALGARAVLLTPHPDQLPRGLPSHVLHLKYAPLRRLAPRAAALVHHGGIGTLAEGLRSAVPQIAVPLFFDQFDNAQRLKELGVGRSLPAQRCDAAALTASLKQLLGDGALHRRCRQIQSYFSGADPAVEIAGLVEQVARDAITSGTEGPT